MKEVETNKLLCSLVIDDRTYFTPIDFVHNNDVKFSILSLHFDSDFSYILNCPL